jgi:HEPN domain-containing protein
MLTKFQSPQLQKVIDIIIQSAFTEKIFLLGATAAQHRTENIFEPEPIVQNKHTHYYLMVLLDLSENRCHNDLQDTIEGRCQNPALATPVTSIVESIHDFNEWLTTGHPFAITIHQHGFLVHDAGNYPFSTPGITNQIALNDQLNKEHTRWQNRVSEFIAGAELYILRRQYILAAFLLHQAVEQALTILLRVITYYKANTHNLDKLIRYCSPFSSELSTVFPCNTDKEHQLFRQLQRAYNSSRYKDDYYVSEKEILTLMDRVKRIETISSDIIEKKIQHSTFERVISN